MYNSIKKNKIHWKNPNQEVVELYTENYEMLLKEMKEYTYNWKAIPCSWFGKLDIFKMLMLHNVIHK